MGRPAIGERAMTDAERQRRRRERLKEQGLLMDSSQVKALAYIRASGEAGADEWGLMAASGIRTEAHLCYLATLRKAERSRYTGRWYTPENLPPEDLERHLDELIGILLDRGVSPEELIARIEELSG